MGQVPPPDAPPVGIVGNGRVARHFRHYFGHLGLAVRTWARRDSAAPPGVALAACPTVLLLIRDDAIVPFVESQPELRRKRLVHCSGSLVTPLAEGAHPLMTFGPALYEPAVYEAVPFVTESGGTPFPELLPGLPNPWFAVPRAERARYHALCVLAGNCSAMLWLKLFDELERRFGIPPSAAFPYLARVTANLMTTAGEALTGPLARGDRRTIDSNLRALEGDPFQPVYAAFVRAHDQRS
jgi:predicted short-subunit dehydrogenase-like oxidoreductase (DUF2520 family)